MLETPRQSGRPGDSVHARYVWHRQSCLWREEVSSVPQSLMFGTCRGTVAGRSDMTATQTESYFEFGAWRHRQDCLCHTIRPNSRVFDYTTIGLTLRNSNQRPRELLLRPSLTL